MVVAECGNARAGESEAKFLEGQGIARQRQAIVHGLRDSVVVSFAAHPAYANLPVPV